MTTRREFLQAGIAASVFPVVASRQTEGLIPPSTPFYRVVFDRRFSGGRAFGNAAQQLGAAVQSIEGDITSLWYNDLSGRSRKGAVALAGVTLNGALFCLDELVRDRGMRVVFRAEHHRPGHQQNVDERAWGVEAATLVTRVAERARELMPPALTVTHLTPPEGHMESLVSWVIVPAGARMVG